MLIATKIVRILAVIVFIPAVFYIAAGSLVPIVLGAMPLTVYTHSMQPAYGPGDAVVVDLITTREQADELKVGDVIAYEPTVREGPYRVTSDELAGVQTTTHRITAISTNVDGRTFHTQGDANSLADDYTVTQDNLRGKVLYSVTGYGHVLELVSSATPQQRTLAAIGLVATAVVYLLLPQRKPETVSEKVPSTTDAESARTGVSSPEPAR